MDEDAQTHDPIPPQLHGRIRELSHDLQRARQNLATGRLKPEQYARLTGVLDARLEALEAEVHARLLHEARGGRPATAWKPRGPGAS